MKSFYDFGIIIPSHKTAGTIKVKCPECGNKPSHKGRKDLSVNISEGLWKCHSGSCGFSGTLGLNHKQTAKIEKEYKLPVWKNNTDLSVNLVKWFEGRGISQFALRQMKITEGEEYMPQVNEKRNTIQFNYFQDEKLVNVKFRDGAKNFKMVSGAKLIMYNLDGIKGNDWCIITEGEIDALSYWEIGFHNVVSVPNGASTGSNNFEYIDNCIEYFDDKDKIYIATDTDKAGINLRNELIRRLGAEKCYIVEYGEFKDANDLLKANGKEALRQSIENAKEIKVDGIFSIEDVWGQMLYGFRNGKNRGTSTYIQTLNNHWTWRTGEVNIWTGYNNEGKSNFVNQLAVLKSMFDNWKFGAFSPENYPISDYYDDLIHCYVGKTCDKYYHSCMSEDEYVKAAEFIQDHFFVINPEDSYRLENIMDKSKYLTNRKGVKGIIIDPYNQIEHHMERGEREDLYISKFMTKLKRQSIDLDISMNLVAHQVTPSFSGKEDYPQPDSYKIKGGGTFSDKADNVIVVWRPYRRSDPQNTEVRIIVAKIKKQRLVGVPGEISLFYSRKKNQYFEDFANCDLNGINNYSLIKIDSEVGSFETTGNFYESSKEQLEANFLFDTYGSNNPEDLPF